MTQTLLIISGGDESAEIARRVRQIGLTVVVSDSNPQAPAFAFADSCLIADVHGASETAAAAERYSRKIRKIDGVLCVAHAALTAATVVDRLRLPGLPLHVAELVSDRLAIRRCFASAGIAAPWHAEISTPQELQRAVIAKGRELVIKPVENRGPDGVQRLTEVEDLAAAFQLARSHSSNERVIVEQGLEGRHIHIAACMLDGACHAVESIKPHIVSTVERAASALGIRDGSLVCEIAVHQETPHVVEISARLGSSDFLAAAMRLALGAKVSQQDLHP